jgi:hypothetical protein
MTDHLLQILLYVTSAIGTIVTAASAAAKFIDPLSPLGQWVAWVASCPIGHSPRVVKTVRLPSAAEKKATAITEAMKTMGPSIVLIAALSAITATQGCALFRGAVVAGKAACQSELVNAPDVIAEAKVRGVSVGQLVDAFCGLVDVAAIFAAEPKPGVARTAMSPRDQAVTLLRAKGELE